MLPPPLEQRKPVERPPDPIDLGPDGLPAGDRASGPAAFEDRLTRFMKDSQERLLDLKRNMESKRGIKKR